MSNSRDDFKTYVFKHYDGKTIFSSDDLTVVLRGHLLIENILEKMLDITLDMSVFEERYLTFDLKLKIAHALNLLGDLFPIVKRLNKIRNDFAHNIEMKLEDVDITLFEQWFESKGYKDDSGWNDDEVKRNKKLRLSIVIHCVLGRLSAMYEQSLKNG